MDGQEHSFELPQPQPENSLVSSDLSHKQEKGLPLPELPSTGGATPSPVKSNSPIASTNPQSTNQQNSSIDDASSATSNLPVIADDNDLIEKEWVDKAKHIVEQTRDDPHKQSQEINKFKAGYMKKRYNKDLKIEE